MKVEELIARLQGMDPNAIVVIWWDNDEDRPSGYTPLVGIQFNPKGDYLLRDKGGYLDIEKKGKTVEIC